LITSSGNTFVNSHDDDDDDDAVVLLVLEGEIR